MVQRGGNRNHKQAAKAVRRKQVVAAKQQGERLASSLWGRVTAAAASPVERCLRTADMVEAGIGHVILAKRLPSGALGCAFFLVDLLCLGVKDAFYREMAPSDLDEHVEALTTEGQELVAMDPASAKRLITEAVAFATGSGMTAARDYAKVVRIFEGTDAASAVQIFSFGRDGRPVYVPGPNDSLSKMRDIERTLTRTRGTDGWDVDILSGLKPSKRIAALGVAELLRHETMDDGFVIDHQGSTEPPDA